MNYKQYLTTQNIVLITGAILFAEFVLVGLVWTAPKQQLNFWGNTTEVTASKQEISTVVREFLRDIRDLHPSKGYGKIPPLTKWNKDMAVDHHKFQDEHTPVTVEMLEDYLIVDDDSKLLLHKQHEEVKNRMPPVPTAALNGRGVVMTGGGSLFGNALVGIRFVLEYHPGLPIELWMARKEYEPHYCDQVFPALNVSCMVMEDFFGDEVDGFDYMGFPLKSLALLGTSFEEVYFMDIDSFAMKSINDMFESDAYKETGFISWPDYWWRVTTPEFYEVAGVLDLKTVDKTKEMITLENTVQEQFASESGQMVINKKKHWRTLLLAAYYNLNGKEYYYPLLSQQPMVDGFGDKETFVAAAAVLGQPAYQVKGEIVTFGYDTKGKWYHGSAMVQKDPISDYKRNHDNKKDVKVKSYIIHANNMKLSPFFIFSGNAETKFSTPNMRHQKRRNMGPKDLVVKEFGYDAELRLFQVLQNVICDWLVNATPEHAGQGNMVNACESVQKFIEWLEQNDRNPWA